MAESGELRPGAELSLDFRNDADENIAEVEQRLDRIDGAKAKIIFLKQLLETYKYALIEIFDDLKKQEEKLREQYRREGSTPETARSRASRPRYAFVEKGKRFELHLIERLKYLAKMLKIEDEAVEQPAQEIAHEPAASGEAAQVKRLSIAQSVWAIHYLLTEARMSYADVDKAEVARFISALTGRNYDNVYDRVLNKHQRNEKATQKDLAAVRSWFKRLGMIEIVKKIDRERNIG